MSLTRRRLIQTAMGIVVCRVSGLPTSANATSRDSAALRPGIAAQRIDGRAKVTGQKIYARDFHARDMAGWPRSQWYGLYLHALSTEHVFLGVDLSSLSQGSRPRRIVLADQFTSSPALPAGSAASASPESGEQPRADAGPARVEFNRPLDLECDLMVRPGHVPNYLGQPVALLLFDSAASFRAARAEMQFNDAAFQSYAAETSQSAGMGEVYPPEAIYVKYQSGEINFSYAAADAETYLSESPGYRRKIAQALAGDSSLVSQPIACDMGAVDPMFMEPETGLAWYDSREQTLNIVLGSQSPDGDVSDLAVMFGAADAPVKIAAVNLTNCFPGGGFGGRDSSPFSLMLALAAPFSDGNPVRLELDRFTQFRTGLKRHAAKVTGRVVAEPDMKLRAIEAELELDGGGRRNLSSSVAGLAAFSMGSGYRLPMADISSRAVHSANVSAGSMRGFGGPQAFFAIETALDELAARQGWDPIALRRANVLGTGDQTIAGGPVLQSLRFDEMLDAAEAHPLWKERDSLKASNTKSGRSYGTGLALSMQAYGSSGNGVVAAVHLEPDGSVRVETSGVDMGNGSATTLAVVVASVLGVNASRVVTAGYRLWDQTGLTVDDEHGLGWQDPKWTPKSVSSSSACLTAFHQVHAVQETARALFQGSLMAAARLLWQRPELSSETVAWKDGLLLAAEGNLKPLSLPQLAAVIHAEGLPHGALGHGFYQGSWAEADFPSPAGTVHLRLDGLSFYTGTADAPPVMALRQNASGTGAAAKRYVRTLFAPSLNIVALTVDHATGQVDIQNVVTILNAGRIHVPALVLGQSQGGIAMALSYALLEELAGGMDGPAGGGVNLTGYQVARMQDVPLATSYQPGGRAQELIILPEVPEDGGTGRGIAEAVMTAVAPAISNALRDATGRRFSSLPITPSKILQELAR